VCCFALCLSCLNMSYLKTCVVLSVCLVLSGLNLACLVLTWVELCYLLLGCVVWWCSVLCCEWFAVLDWVVLCYAALRWDVYVLYLSSLLCHLVFCYLVLSCLVLNPKPNPNPVENPGVALCKYQTERR
jgi:hypothetical protein